MCTPTLPAVTLLCTIIKKPAADMNGRIVIRKTVTGTASRIETALLPNGLYILNVKDLNGLSRRTEKIIIKH